MFTELWLNVDIAHSVNVAWARLGLLDRLWLDSTYQAWFWHCPDGTPRPGGAGRWRWPSQPPRLVPSQRDETACFVLRETATSQHAATSTECTSIHTHSNTTDTTNHRYKTNSTRASREFRTKKKKSVWGNSHTTFCRCLLFTNFHNTALIRSEWNAVKLDITNPWVRQAARVLTSWMTSQHTPILKYNDSCGKKLSLCTLRKQSVPWDLHRFRHNPHWAHNRTRTC